MKKTLIALAVGAALAPAAHADVVLTGVVNLGPTVHHTSGATAGAVSGNNIVTPAATAPQTGNTVGLSRNYSWLGVGSTEDLGNGLKLDVFLQFQMEPEKSANAGITNRNSRVGFTGENWGGVWWGTNENIYERYLYSTDPLDGAMGVGGNLSIFGTPGYNVVFDVGHSGAGFYRRQEQTIWYDSPNFGGFTFGVAYAMPAFKTATANPYIFSGGVKYAGTGLPLEVWAAYEKHKDYFGINAMGLSGGANGTSSNDHAMQGGVAYTFGDIRLFGLYEQLKYNADGLAGTAVNEYKRNAWGLGFKWNLASGYFGGQFLQAQDGTCQRASGAVCSAGETGSRLIGLGYFHNMSKQTQVYLVGAVIQNKDAASYGPAGALGVYGGGTVAPGANISSFTVGVKHSF